MSPAWLEDELELAGYGDELLVASGPHVRQQGLSQPQRPKAVDAEGVQPVGEVEPPNRLAFSKDAGVGDQDVDRLVSDRLAEGGDGAVVIDVERMDGDALYLAQRMRAVWIAHASDEAPAVRRILSSESQSDASVGPGDQDGAHKPLPFSQMRRFNAQVV